MRLLLSQQTDYPYQPYRLTVLALRIFRISVTDCPYSLCTIQTFAHLVNWFLHPSAKPTTGDLLNDGQSLRRLLMLLVFWPSRGLAINVTIHDRTINTFSTMLGPEERLCPRTTGYYVGACRTSPSGGEVFLIDSMTYAIISLGLS